MKLVSAALVCCGLLFVSGTNALGATLALSPASTALILGDTVTLSLLLDTSGAAVDGVDIFGLRYDPLQLQLQDNDTSLSGTQIAPGTLLPITLANFVDVSHGIVVFSQVSSGPFGSFTGSGILATMTFQSLAVGTASLTFDFIPGNTNDTNVASNGEDILSSVTNGTVLISPTAVPEPGSLGLLGLGAVGLLAAHRARSVMRGCR
jgi:hypothetical protein